MENSQLCGSNSVETSPTHSFITYISHRYGLYISIRTYSFWEVMRETVINCRKAGYDKSWKLTVWASVHDGDVKGAGVTDYQVAAVVDGQIGGGVEGALNEALVLS